MPTFSGAKAKAKRFAGELLFNAPPIVYPVAGAAGLGAGALAISKLASKRNNELNTELEITKMDLDQARTHQYLLSNYSPETMENYTFLSYSTLPEETKAMVDNKSLAANLDPSEVYDTLIPWQLKVQGEDAVEAFLTKKVFANSRENMQLT
jgi:hypothetical protein